METQTKDNRISIRYLPLSTRTLNCLLRAEITTLNELLNTNNNDLLKIRHLGTASLNEIKDIKEDKSRRPDQNNKLYKALYTYVFNRICENNTTISNVKDITPKELINTGVVEDVIEALINNNKVELDNNQYVPKHKSIIEHIENAESPRTKEIMNERLNGHALRPIGETVGLSGEMVHNIQEKFFENIPIVKEDKFKNIFEKYAWTLESFIHVFDEVDITYNYLSIRYKLGKTPICELLNDDNISRNIQNKIEDIVYSHILTVNNINMNKNKEELLEYVKANYCKDEMHYKELEKIYYDFLEEHNLSNEPKYTFHKNYFRHSLINHKNILWKAPNMMRYYDTSNITSEELVELLKLDEYIDIDISISIIFNKNIDTMKKLDIRDKYELHNLIRKVVDIEKYDIKLPRNPTIIFGDGNRHKQMLYLLVNNSPITKMQLAKLYSETYGPSIDVILVNYFHEIYKYRKGRLFIYDEQSNVI